MQQMAMQQHQAQAGNPQQIHSMQQAQIAAQQQHQHQQAQAQAQAAALLAQQNQAQSQPQAQQQTQSNPQAQQQVLPQAPQQPSLQQQHVAAAMMQQRQGNKLRGQTLMRLMQFGDHLSNFQTHTKPLQAYIESGLQNLAAQSAKQNDDINYWLGFVDQFFSPKGVLRHSVWIVEEKGNSDKQYEITYPALARYFHTHFESGIKNMQLITEKGLEKELPNNGHYVESQKSSLVYWFENGSQVRDFVEQLWCRADLTVNRERHTTSSF